MGGSFPLSKLGILIIRQISRPIANSMKERAKNHYFFRTYVCMPPAQIYHWCEVKTRLWVLGLGRSGEIPKLNETMAIEIGANMIGEGAALLLLAGIVFAIAATILIYEYNRSAAKEEAREEAQQQRLAELDSRVEDLRFTVEEQGAKIRELSQLAGRLDVAWRAYQQQLQPSGADS
ncbi:putative OPA3-like protein CG13603 isoform X1 [Amphibalanus amphitrite]|uniref:putative OPA3-like protein CG13603 isoform X1 n=1 Tax=Amphibalanus amphitrite TaxID=1232801 RepID=UPI001C922D9C|nr:putative OPA3-like protein CG13603 isoform X1 [Amphibalanus amphitrite]